MGCKVERWISIAIIGQSPSHERRTTVIKEREPLEETTVIRKEHREPRDKIIVHERD
jgi:hypothetical protein